MSLFNTVLPFHTTFIALFKLPEYIYFSFSLPLPSSNPLTLFILLDLTWITFSDTPQFQIWNMQHDSSVWLVILWLVMFTWNPSLTEFFTLWLHVNILAAFIHNWPQNMYQECFVVISQKTTKFILASAYSYINIVLSRHHNYIIERVSLFTSMVIFLTFHSFCYFSPLLVIFQFTMLYSLFFKLWSSLLLFICQFCFHSLLFVTSFWLFLSLLLILSPLQYIVLIGS